MENQSKEIRDLIVEETRRRGARIAKTSDREFIEFLTKENKILNKPISLTDVIRFSEPKTRENLIARLALREIRSYIDQISREYLHNGLIVTECNNYQYVDESDIIEIAANEYRKAINAIALKTIAKVFPKLKEIRERRKEARKQEKIANAYRLHYDRFFARTMSFAQYEEMIAPSIPNSIILQIVKQ